MSQTRSASSDRSTRSSGRSAGSAKTTGTRRTNSGSKARKRTTNTPAARHYRGGNHRTNGKGPKLKGRRKHLILKWILGLIGAGLVAGIGLFAYLYITTEIPQPEKVAMAENTTVYYNDGVTELGTFSKQNRTIIQCNALPKYVGNAIVASENRTFYEDNGIDISASPVHSSTI